MLKVKDIRIEIAGICNAECPYCPAGKEKIRSNSFMEVDFFKKIIEHLRKKGILECNPVIGLMIRGEPFLHPNIDDILRFLYENGLKASISSNFIKIPNLSEKALKSINDLTFSLSGLTNNTYKRIYGVNVEKPLKNFDYFLSKVKKVNKDAFININWIKYKFNKSEFQTAKEYFEKKGVHFNPINASYIDYDKIVELLENNINVDEIEKDIFIKEQLNRMKNASKHNLNLYFCDVFDDIFIDEYGNWVTCSYMNRYNKFFVRGKYTDITKENIFNRVVDNPFCNKCLKYLISDSIFAPDTVDVLNSILDTLKEDVKCLKDENNTIAIYGFGTVGQIILYKCLEMNIKIKYIIDDNKQGRVIKNFKIVNIDDIDGKNVVILLCVRKKETKNALLKKIKQEIKNIKHIITFKDYNEIN